MELTPGTHGGKSAQSSARAEETQNKSGGSLTIGEGAATFVSEKTFRRVRFRACSLRPPVPSVQLVSQSTP